MVKEIGSDFCELDNIQEDISTKPIWNHYVGKKYFFRSGRNAIKALNSLFNSNNKVILMPEYLCTTEENIWLDDNWQVYYYKINDNFTINLKSLKELYKEKYPEIIWVQQYFGFEQIDKNVERFLNSVKNNVTIVEDITHNWFSASRKYKADYYVGSLRKFFAVADGGILLSSKELTSVISEQGNTELVEKAKQAFSRKKEYLRTGCEKLKEIFRNLYGELSGFYEDNDKLYGISDFSYELIEHQNYNELVQIRRANWEYIKEHLEDCDKFCVYTYNYNESTVPLFAVLQCRSKEMRNSLQNYLCKHKVYASRYWQPDESMKNNSFIFNKILVIPIDQRYKLEDMQRIIEVIVQWEKNL